MRWVFLFFVIGNIILGVWGIFFPPGQSGRSVVSSTIEGYPPIELLEAPQKKVSEPSPARKSASLTEAKTSQKPAAATKEASASCYRLGPITTSLEANRLIDSLAERKIASQRQEVRERVVVGYWVYIPPLGSRADATKVAHELAQKGVTDYLIVVTQNKINAISLGIYPSEEEAAQRAKNIKSLGYETAMEPHYRQTISYWITYTNTRDNSLSSKEIEEMQHAQPRLEVQNLSCKEHGEGKIADAKKPNK